MNTFWLAVVGTSALAFALKFLGHSIPEKYVNHPRLQSVNRYIPVALLAALVAVQSFAVKTALYLDHRAFGVGVAMVALFVKAPYPVVVLSAALSSALFVHLS